MTRITNHEFLLHLPLFGARITLLIAALLLAIAPMPASAAGTPDYSLVPKLQEIKEHPPAPDFTLPDPAGNRKSLKDYRGKVVMLAFWASWCPYCREELPQMERLYREFKGKGLEIVGINIKDKRDEALALVRKNQLTYPVLMDPEGEIGLLYGAFSTPTVYLIDRKGTVLARMWGPAGWYSPEARKLIAALLEQR